MHQANSSSGSARISAQSTLFCALLETRTLAVPKIHASRFRAFLSRRATHTFVFRSTLWTRTSRHTLLATDLASKKLPYKETKWIATEVRIALRTGGQKKKKERAEFKKAKKVLVSLSTPKKRMCARLGCPRVSCRPLLSFSCSQKLKRSSRDCAPA